MQDSAYHYMLGEMGTREAVRSITPRFHALTEIDPDAYVTTYDDPVPPWCRTVEMFARDPITNASASSRRVLSAYDLMRQEVPATQIIDRMAEEILARFDAEREAHAARLERTIFDMSAERFFQAGRDMWDLIEVGVINGVSRVRGHTHNAVAWDAAADPLGDMERARDGLWRPVYLPSTPRADPGPFYRAWSQATGAPESSTTSPSRRIVGTSRQEDARVVARREVDPPPTHEELGGATLAEHIARQMRERLGLPQPAEWLSDGEMREADDRAERLLMRHLTNEQRVRYLKFGAFVVKSQHGNTYRIHSNWPIALGGNVVCTSGPHASRSFCLTVSQVPQADKMLAQMLLLEADEDTFLKTANWW